MARSVKMTSYSHAIKTANPRRHCAHTSSLLNVESRAVNSTTIGGEKQICRSHTIEFSETAFGFAVTHSLVNLRTGGFGLQRVRLASKRISGRSSPQLISQLIDIERKLVRGGWLKPHEARAIVYPYKSPYFPTLFSEKVFPVDMAMNVRGVHCFLQFKRSEPYLKYHGGRAESSKISKKKFRPLYRVYIRGGKGGKSGDRIQWDTLKKLENDLKPKHAAVVRYVAPAFHKLSELSQFHNNGFLSRIEHRWPVMCFSPNSFTLPSDGTHWISFDGIGTTGLRCSSEPKEVRHVLPLVYVISDGLLQAPALKDSMGPIRKSLDDIAADITADIDDDRKFDDPPPSLEHRTILDTLGISRSSEEDESGPPDVLAFARSPGILDDQQSDWPDGREVELADAIRDFMNDGEHELVRSLMSFAIDYCVADYRCRQILEQPLMVYANPESGFHPDWDTGRTRKA